MRIPAIFTNKADARTTALRNVPSRTLLEAFWLLVAVTVPLWVNLWARQPFDPSKVALLRTLVWFMAAVWIATGGLRGRAASLKRNPLRWPLLFLATAQIAATIVAADRGLSLWGSYLRAQGLLTSLTYLLLFLVISSALNTWAQAWRLLYAMVGTAVPIVLLVAVQALGWNPFGLISDARSPIYATLGRANFVGAYLALLLPLTVTAVAAARAPWPRLAGMALLLAQIIAIALSFSRSAWLAAAVSLLVLVLLLLWPQLTVEHRRWVVWGGATLLLLGLIALAWLSRADSGSIAARFTIWRATLPLVAQRPLLGYGPDSLELVFPGVYPPQLVYYQGRGVLVDRAHNIFLDWLVTTGLVGLLAWLLLLVTYVRALWRYARSRLQFRQRLLLLACLAAILGNLAGNLASFDVTATASATWMLMGLTMGLLGARQDGSGERLNRRLSRPLALVPISLLLAAAFITSAYYNGRPLLADIAARTAERHGAAEDWRAAIDAGRRSVALWPHEPAYHQTLAWAYQQQALATPDEPWPWLALAEEHLFAARDLRPDDFRQWAALGDLYSTWAIQFDSHQLPLAEAAFRRATALAPNVATLYMGWGVVYYEMGHIDHALVRLRQAVDLDATDGYAFFYLGNAIFRGGQIEDAATAYEQAVRWEPRLVNAHVALAHAYWHLGHHEKATLNIQRALQLDPQNPGALDLWRRLDSSP